MNIYWDSRSLYTKITINYDIQDAETDINAKFRR